EIDNATLKFSSWWRKNIQVRNKKNSHSTVDIFGLPYTSSGECAGLWNTNADNMYLYDEDYRFDALLITVKNEVMVMLKTCNDKIQYIYIGNLNNKES
ncbi:MAG: hypothetical protein RR806_07890, partial [Oscillospiraceae bacterium]